ncbi:DUF6691 family protein [Acinetobacter terrestris]|uniref:DUF6691 family protein n=1 Tax=Acinetobacter terrestris TaxID=2529843 RepID=UPI003CC8150F
MLGAIAVAFILFRREMHNQALKTAYVYIIDLPKNNKIDYKLVMGSLIFVIGWGIAGICPAPSLTLIGLGYYQALYFMAAMMIGMLIHRKLMGRNS